MFIRLVSPWFFGAPDVQLRSLRKIWVDNFMLYPDWSDFIEKMKSEWSDFLLPSTVSLSTNVAFLAIPNLSMDNSSLNAAQILSYISMTVSMGSIIMTLLLTRQNGHHLRMRETAFKVVLFLRNRRHPRLGLEALAVVYSLPYGLILWAVITFLAAFSFVCFGGNDTLAMSTTGAVWIIIAMLVVWSLYIGRETKSLPKWLIKAFSFCGTDKSSAANGSKPSDCDGTTVM
ncbi:hypothetical protein CERSUDRAFT_98927 [Gelatoporia subvermispora B]|uniref:Uncharacterized protein n=1 Tax=Ceriporiopsis subvermispora (strain B) TaxID=914234 RepID=M2QLC0_CERS8|nr:hypothetical protein CERSUDRAFT_98927 [Gelatoporia subvermispora B]